MKFNPHKTISKLTNQWNFSIAKIWNASTEYSELSAAGSVHKFIGIINLQLNWMIKLDWGMEGIDGWLKTSMFICIPGWHITLFTKDLYILIRIQKQNLLTNALYSKQYLSTSKQKWWGPQRQFKWRLLRCY